MESLKAIQAAFNGASRKLHIGGTQSAPGWEILNANAAPNVDHVGNANDLSRFEDGTFSALYASHVLEHLDYNGELLLALKEWRRVLGAGGRLFVSVPDLDVLAHLFLQKDSLSVEERFLVMRMMFGGHVDRYDYHQVGLNLEFMSAYLAEAGFRGLRKVDSFGFFGDTSELVMRGRRISLNVIADK